MKQGINILINRFYSTKESTVGTLSVKMPNEHHHVFQCFTLEDEFRKQKIKSETRIPSGTYKLGIQELQTSLTKKYAARHDFFKKHLHIEDVPNFTGIYIHIGNTEHHTAGCILVGQTANVNEASNRLLSSTRAYKALYNKIYKFVSKESTYFNTITILDNDLK